MWGGVFSTIDCGLLGLRHKEDAINPIISGFLTGGVLAFRGGVVSMLKNGAIGGAILALIEVSGLAMMMLQMKSQQREAERMQMEAQEAARFAAGKRKSALEEESESSTQLK